MTAAACRFERRDVRLQEFHDLVSVVPALGSLTA